MNSKESGAAAPVILLSYECIYFLPAAWRQGRLRDWVRSIAPFYCVIAAILAAYIFGRIPRAEGLAGNASYQPHLSLSVWLTNLTEYFSILLYRHVHFNAIGVAMSLMAMFGLAVFLRNRTMLFGLAYFVIAITPVALISVRGGNALYAPEPGLGLYFATLLGLTTTNMAVWAALTAGLIAIHAAYWPEPWHVRDTPQWRLADKLRRDYPAMKPGATILFVDDYPAGNGYETMFNMRLFYGDPAIEVFRLKGPAIQQPAPDQKFDHIFTTAFNTYIELDRRNPAESIRWNLLQDYPAGKYFDVDRADHIAYGLSGLVTSDVRGEGWWTQRSARLKFDLYPGDSVLTLRFGVPGFVAAGAKRNLSVIVEGNLVGSVRLDRAGDVDAEFQVPSRMVNASGFTVLQLDVDQPFVKDGQEYGVVLKRAGFRLQ